MRLFLAAALPVAVRAALSAALPLLEPRGSGWRWTRPAGIHLTLRFLGEVDEAREWAARATWRRIAAANEPCVVRLAELGCFPLRGAPHVLWVGLDEREPGAPRLSRLASELELAARELGWPAESRAFRAHLTLARAARGRRPRLAPGVDWPCGAAGVVDRVVLFQSHLDPGGARYTALDSFPLGPEASDRREPA